MRQVVGIGLVSVLGWFMPALAQPQGGGGKPVFISGCRQGECWEARVLAKRLEQQTPRGQLYRLTIGRRSWMDGSPPPAHFSERTQDYVYCSRTRPAYIFADPAGKGYIAHLLNPGGPTFGYNQASHDLYWQVCHGVNPERELDLARKARQLGYSLKLPSNQITLARPRDILQR